MSTNSSHYFFTKPKKTFKCTLFFLINLLITGCFSMSEVSLPEAPPPYGYIADPSPIPTPNENFLPETSARQTPKEEPKKIEAPTVEQKVEKNITNLVKSKNENFIDRKSSHHFRIKAVNDVWILIQDDKGKQIAWKKLSRNEEYLVNQRAPLTLTCSVANSILIYDQKGKKIDYISSGNNNSRINIIRLN